MWFMVWIIGYFGYLGFAVFQALVNPERKAEIMETYETFGVAGPILTWVFVALICLFWPILAVIWAWSKLRG